MPRGLGALPQFELSGGPRLGGRLVERATIGSSPEGRTTLLRIRERQEQLKERGQGLCNQGPGRQGSALRGHPLAREEADAPAIELRSVSLLDLCLMSPESHHSPFSILQLLFAGWEEPC